MLITKDLIERGRSDAGGWNRAQLEAIGVPWPPDRHWQRQTIGLAISQAHADKFLSLRGRTKEKIRSERDDRLKLGTCIQMELLGDGSWHGSLKCGSVHVEAAACSPKALASKLCKKWANRA